MTKINIGYQGIAGAYSEMASENFGNKNFVKINKNNFECFGQNTFEEIFQKVESGELDYGVVPVENSLAGSIHKNYDLLAKHDLKIIGEEIVHVKHQLLVLPGTKLKDIKEVYSHWQALAQCEHNIKKFLPDVKVVEYFDTAGAAQMLLETKDKSRAAISSIKACAVYGLLVLKADFQDDKDNFTRFVVISKNFIKLNGSANSKFKTSILFAGNAKTGFLFKALACFSLRDINLTKIESRPIPKSPWDYYFYVDIDGKYDDEIVKYAIENLGQICKFVKVLGSYEKLK